MHRRDGERVYGYDNCIMTFGAALTAVVLQLTSKVDLFPGLGSSRPLSFVSSLVDDTLHARSVQLFLLFGGALVATRLTAAISGAVRKAKLRERDGSHFLTLLSGQWSSGSTYSSSWLKDRLMLFVTTLMFRMLFVPILFDIQKHGRDNILRRSGRDVLNFPLIATVVRSVGRGANALAASGLSAIPMAKETAT